MSHQTDEDFGFTQEKNLQPTIEKSLGCKLTRGDQYDVYDFYNDECLVELKSRRIKYGAYPTIMVGMNKLKHFESQQKDCYVYFNFTDGLYQWKYNKNEYTSGRTRRVDRGKTEVSNVAYVPIKYLKRIII